MQRKTTYQWLMVGVSLLAVGCSRTNPAHEVGFGRSTGSLDPRSGVAPEDAEQTVRRPTESLQWRMNDASGELRVINLGAPMGCAGRRSTRVERIDTLVEITEIDEPSGDVERSWGCSFDVALAIEVPPGVVSLRLLRDITDKQTGPVLVWQGEIGGPSSDGTVVLNDGPLPPARQNAR
jgi:hypothetical protein